MKYNLTETQKELARWIVSTVRKGDLRETFSAVQIEIELRFWDTINRKIINPPTGDMGTVSVLESEGLLQVNPGKGDSIQCVVTSRLYEAVDSNFESKDEVVPVSAFAQPHPTEISMSIDRLRGKYPDPKILGFLIMRFTGAKPFSRIVEIIKKTAEAHGLVVVRADENEFHADLWGNVRTYLHGCGFGIAVYDRIETNEPNANVGLEVGYLMAMNKPVLLLKDKTLHAIQADLAGKLYKQFDPHEPEKTIPDQLTKWLEDNGILVPKRA